jgi:hypothetical protein
VEINAIAGAKVRFEVAPALPGKRFPKATNVSVEDHNAPSVQRRQGWCAVINDLQRLLRRNLKGN